MSSGRRAGKRSPAERIGGWASPFAIGVAAGALLSLADLLAKPKRAQAPAPPPPAPPLNPWRRLLRRSFKTFAADRIPAAAASATFYGLLALIPALSAFAALFGLFANIEDARAQLLSLGALLPSGAISILGDQLARLEVVDHGRLGLAFAISLAVSIWSSNAGVRALIDALNVAYEARERRGFIHLTLLSLALTVGAILLSVVAVAFVVAAPELLANTRLEPLAPVGLWRWPIFLALTLGMFSALYRYGPCRRPTGWRWVVVGAGAAAAGWLLMSGLFSWYVANFGHYDRTYGSLGAVVGFLTWTWLSLITVLYGAELNAALEDEAAMEGRATPAKLAATATETCGIGSAAVAAGDAPQAQGARWSWRAFRFRTRRSRASGW